MVRAFPPSSGGSNAQISFRNPSGMELPTEQAAQRLAREIAKQISIDVDDESLKDVIVKTDDGKEIYKAPIKPE